MPELSRFNLPTPNSFRQIIPPDTLPLGFGTGALLSERRSRREALTLIETAIECGVTYFDTARMYGAGRAEGILGEVAAKTRDRMIIASKAGIVPESRSVFIRAMGRSVRLSHKLMPATRNYLNIPLKATPRFGVFGIADLRRSLEKSLQ